MKKLMLSIGFLGVFGVVQAQRQNTYFLKNNGQQVIVRDSADFIRIIQEPDSGQVNYKVKEYFLDGTVRFTGMVSKINPLTYEGDFISFDKKGTKIYQATYNNGMPVGKGSSFYGNGTLKNEIEYYQEDGIWGTKTTKTKLMYLADSLGHVMVKDGNGHSIRKDLRNGKDECIEEGDYKDGLMTGEWTSKSNSGNFWYKELYEQNKLIKGESYQDGVTYQYAETENLPEFKGGMEAFYKYLMRFVKYPTDAAQRRISGVVSLSFTVGSNGRLTDIKVERGVYPSIDQEAIRVLRESPKWIPGRQHGIPVRVRYHVPISFNMS